ncbi:hypothetical protein FGO68_gene10696 [Halteria grandinella]|uniref:Uncharacterized protein n=1 Tax=Halteria grandinella TaxID=5974 RepID=A0A8J8NV07_HALGN|nr:hypothetical protein FGO68_gene10696 [Halteria grandinella]
MKEKTSIRIFQLHYVGQSIQLLFIQTMQLIVSLQIKLIPLHSSLSFPYLTAILKKRAYYFWKEREIGLIGPCSALYLILKPSEYMQIRCFPQKPSSKTVTHHQNRLLCNLRILKTQQDYNLKIWQGLREKDSKLKQNTKVGEVLVKNMKLSDLCRTLENSKNSFLSWKAHFL